MEITLPVIGTYREVANYLKLSRKTIYKMTCKRQFARGIYLGRGRFNMSKLKECIEKKGTYLHEAAQYGKFMAG